MALGFGQVDTDAPLTVQELANRLRSAALHAGYGGVRELAAGTGIGRSTISDALAARRVPTWQTIAALLRGCGVAPDRDWSAAHEAARGAVEEQKRAARDGGLPGREPEEETPPSQSGPGTFSIRPPYGELPPRVRGRDELLEQLEVRLAEGESRAQILYGMGGCGKTTVALNLARHARGRGYRVFWLSASTPDRLVTGMREVARELGAEKEAIEAAWSGLISATDLVWQELDAAERPWLLVVDNADEPAWLAAESGAPGDGTGWLRSSRAGMTVVTSRVGNPGIWGREADTHRIDVLDPADGRDVLLDLAGEAGDPAEALVLAKRLDGLPLALKLAGSYLARSARGAGLLRHRGRRSGGRLRGFVAYTEALGEAGAGLLDQGEHWRLDESDTEHMHRRLVGRTWELSLDLLEEQQLPEARSLMRMLSCCASAPFPVELLDPEVLAEAGGNLRTRLGADPERADRALEALVDLSLIDVVDIGPVSPTGEWEPVPCLVSHRLVLEANALRLADRPAWERMAIWRATARILEQGSAPAPEYPGNWHWWRLLAPHVVAALAATPDGDEDSDAAEALLPLLRAGLAAYAFCNFASLDLGDELARLLLRRGSVLAPDHPVRLSIRHRAALSLLDGQEELREYEDILAEQLEQLGPDHPETLITRYNVATSRRVCGQTSDSEEEAELRAVLEARRRALGPNNPYTLLTHGKLAELMMARSHGEEQGNAEYRALIEHTESLSPDDHRFLPLQNRHQMAHALDAAERWTEAEAEYRSVLADLEEFQGQETISWDLTRCLTDNLAHQRRYSDALAVLDESLLWFDGCDEAHSPSRSPALVLRHKRGHMLRHCGRASEAEREIRAVLAERLRTVDPEDSVVLFERHCLAHTLGELERHGEAQDELRDVVTLYAEILGPDDKQTRNVRFCLARMLHSYGDQAEALRLYEQVQAGETVELGAEHPDTLMTSFRRDQCRFDMGSLLPPEAVVAFERTLTMLVERLGDDHRWVRTIREVLAATRAAEGIHPTP